MSVTTLVPCRFLTITAHFVITVALFWTRDDNVRAGLPLHFTAKELEQKDTEFIVALSLSLAAMLFEFVGFFGGISTFRSLVSLTSICAHTTACIALAFFVWDVMDCDLYWFVFGFCCAVPMFIEIVVMVSVLGLRRPP